MFAESFLDAGVGSRIAWLEKVKTACKESGHLKSALRSVGRALVYTPADPDGLWLHHSAAAVSNARDADDIRGGFRAGVFNSRGVHWVDPTGKPEKELAAKYRAQAETTESAGYYRLASTLRELADEYEREAERVSSRERFAD